MLFESGKNQEANEGEKGGTGNFWDAMRKPGPKEWFLHIDSRFERISCPRLQDPEGGRPREVSIY